MAATPALRRSYAATGPLRIALNFGNGVLIGRDAKGRPHGITHDLGLLLAEEIGCEPRFVAFDQAADVSGSAALGQWDVCFLAVDPARAEAIAFTRPYVRIAGCYVVAASTGVAQRDAVVTQRLRIGVVEGSAYALHLARQPGAERLVRFSGMAAMLHALDDGAVDGIAGIEAVMAAHAAARADWWLVQPPFMTIEQAMGVPAGRVAAAAHLRGFIAALTDGGTVRDILERHGVAGECAVTSMNA